jgi:ABC-type oligopeptide transport system ATPase subunit
MTNPAAPTQPKSEQPILLEVKNLKTWFPIRRGILQRTVGHVKAVDDVSFFVRRGETLGLVGESGCGKTTVGRTILRLIPNSGGSVRFDGRDVLSAGALDLR